MEKVSRFGDDMSLGTDLKGCLRKLATGFHRSTHIGGRSARILSVAGIIGKQLLEGIVMAQGNGKEYSRRDSWGEIPVSLS